MVFFVFCFKQKTAYEMRISDWSSDVCSSDLLKAGNRTITVTNPDKVYWPGEKITKSDLVRYYQHMAPYMLPYLKERPQSLHRHPDGIDRKAVVSGKRLS